MQSLEWKKEKDILLPKSKKKARPKEKPSNLEKKE